MNDTIDTQLSFPGWEDKNAAKQSEDILQPEDTQKHEGTIAIDCTGDIPIGDLPRFDLADPYRAETDAKKKEILEKDWSQAFFPETSDSSSTPEASDGSSANHYKLPPNATELQDLISFKDMNAQIGGIFRTAYKYGSSSHNSRLIDAKKIKFYIEAEIERLERYR